MAIGTGCGGGGEPTSTQSSGPGPEQAAESAAAQRRNEAVRKEYEQRKQVEAPTPAELEAKRAATDFYSILGAEKADGDPDETTIDSGSFCDLMSAAAKAQTIHFAKVSSGIAQKWDCESAIELIVIRAKRTGTLRALDGAKIVAVNAEGNRATATVRFGDGTATSLPLVKEGGEWKLAASPLFE